MHSYWRRRLGWPWPWPTCERHQAARCTRLGQEDEESLLPAVCLPACLICPALSPHSVCAVWCVLLRSCSGFLDPGPFPGRVRTRQDASRAMLAATLAGSLTPLHSTPLAAGHWPPSSCARAETRVPGLWQSVTSFFASAAHTSHSVPSVVIPSDRFLDSLSMPPTLNRKTKQSRTGNSGTGTTASATRLAMMYIAATRDLASFRFGPVRAGRGREENNQNSSLISPGQPRERATTTSLATRSCSPELCPSSPPVTPAFEQPASERVHLSTCPSSSRADRNRHRYAFHTTLHTISIVSTASVCPHS